LNAYLDGSMMHTLQRRVDKDLTGVRGLYRDEAAVLELLQCCMKNEARQLNGLRHPTANSRKALRALLKHSAGAVRRAKHAQTHRRNLKAAI
jgi:hypothetical protein